MQVKLLDDKNINYHHEIDSDIKETLDDAWFDAFQKTASSKDLFLKATFDLLPNFFSNDIDVINYRQGIMKDVIANQMAFKMFYNQLTVSNAKIRSSHIGISDRTATSAVSSSVWLLEKVTKSLQIIKEFYSTNASYFKSKALISQKEEYDRDMSTTHLNNLIAISDEFKFTSGMYVSCNLDSNFQLGSFTLHSCDDQVLKKRKWKKSKNLQDGVLNDLTRYSLNVNETKYKSIDVVDEKYVAEYNRESDLVLAPFANKITALTKDLIDFVYEVQFQLSFYIGALNVYNQLNRIGMPITFPVVKEEKTINFDELYDLNLCLVKNEKVVGNTLDLSSSVMTLITGANQGGKTTFLRSIAQSYFLGQCGLFVPAKTFEFNVCFNILSHFRKEEDSSMSSGKLDEELNRINHLIEKTNKHSLILFNESFASTTELEGSGIAFDIINALIENDCYIYFVSHMYVLATMLEEKYSDNIKYLRPNRNEDGSRTYKLFMAYPEETSYAEDLYNKIFNN